MRKSWKFMIGTLVVLFLIYVWLKNYTTSVVDMDSKVGSRVGGGELTMSEYYTLKSYMELYDKYLSEEKYDLSYMMLGIPYRRYVSYEEYLEKVKKDNLNDFLIEDINIITNTTYDVLLDNSGDKKHYTLVIDDNKSASVIYPESFLDYKEVNAKTHKNKVEIVLTDYVVNIDKCILNFAITNKSNKKVDFSTSKLLTNEQSKIENNQEFVIDAKETKEITLEYGTNYEFPSQVMLCRNMNDKVIDYVIDIK